MKCGHERFPDTEFNFFFLSGFSFQGSPHWSLMSALHLRLSWAVLSSRPSSFRSLLSVFPPCLRPSFSACSQLVGKHPIANVVLIPSPHVPSPLQSSSSYYFLHTPYTSTSSHILVPDSVFPHHSSHLSQHFHFLRTKSFQLLLGCVPCFSTIDNGRPHHCFVDSAYHL